jgi:hypothetical protein
MLNGGIMNSVLLIDKTGKNINNLIREEEHILQDGFYIIKPRHGHYYTDSFTVSYLNEYNKLLPLPKSYYSYTNFNSKLSSLVGMEICNTIHIDVKCSYKMFKISYQAYGGESNIGAINDSLNTPIDNTIRYNNILNKPIGVKPTNHLHDCKDLYGMEHLNDSISRISLINKVKNVLPISKLIRSFKC